MKRFLAAALLLALTGCAAAQPLAPDPATDPMLLKFAMGFMQGAIYPTNEPGNLAINGDGFFLLSRTLTPRSWDDVIFTRDGVFHWEFTPSAAKNPDGTLVKGQGTFRLINSDGFYVLGYAYQAIENQRPFGVPPEETQGTSLAALDTRTLPDAPGQPPHAVPLQALEIDLAQNPNASHNIDFDAQGLVHLDGVEPKDLAGKPASMFVALAKVQQVLGLRRLNGDFKTINRMYLYQPAAGTVYAGVAGTGNEPVPNRVVGSTNELTPASAEQPIPLDKLDQVFSQLRSAAGR